MAPRQRILIVDRNHRHRKQVGEILEPIAEKICLAGEFEESLQRCRDEPFDIVFSELRIPGGDGLSLLWQLRQIRPELAAVLMSARLPSDTAVEAIRFGVADCLLKPITSSAVLAGLERAMRAKAGLQQPAYAPAPPNQFGRAADPNAPVAVSEALRRVLALAAKCANRSAPVVLQGEYGVGKQTIARTIHRLSARANCPFVTVDCSTLTEQLIRSVLFDGKNARGNKADLCPPISSAEGGTLFLHEIEALPDQVKRIIIAQLEEQEKRADRPAAARFQLIASTSKAAVAADKTLLGCQYLLHQAEGVLIEIPPLRERTEDVRPLAERFLNQTISAPIPGSSAFSDEAVECLQKYQWPGNASELRSAIRHAVAFCNGGAVTRDALPKSVVSKRTHETDEAQFPLTGDFRQMQRQLIQQVLLRFDGNKTAAANALGLNRRKLYRLLSE